MTHEPEIEFEERVVAWFDERYGPENVESQVYLDDVEWYCDIVVETGWCTLFVEVENDAGSVRDGTGQAHGYAGTAPARGVPMVVTPVDHTEPARVEAMRDGGTTLIAEFDHEAGEMGEFIYGG